MTDTVAKRFESIGLPYEITDTPINFVLTGAQKGRAVVALYLRGGVERAFAGFHGNTDAAFYARAAARVPGCYAAYTVQANEKD